MRRFNKKWIEGKTIQSVVTEVRDTNFNTKTQHLAVIIFTDGSKLCFTVGEPPDASGEYNVCPLYLKPKRKSS